MDTKQNVQESYPIGTIFDAVKVSRVESEWGLVCDISEDVKGFVHVSDSYSDVTGFEVISLFWVLI